MKILVVILSVLLIPVVGSAGEAPAQPVDMDKLLQDLRDLDGSTDMQGDHVVGETLC